MRPRAFHKLDPPRHIVRRLDATVFANACAAQSGYIHSSHITEGQTETDGDRFHLLVSFCFPSGSISIRCSSVKRGPVASDFSTLSMLSRGPPLLLPAVCLTDYPLALQSTKKESDRYGIKPPRPRGGRYEDAEQGEDQREDATQMSYPNRANGSSIEAL
jgi:hypothetical protein